MADWFESHRLPFVLGLLALIAVGAVVWLGRDDGRRPLTIEPAGALTPRTDLRVYVTGAVRSPGVYAFTQGDRVEQAVQLAGGFADDADLVAVNLATRLRDEQRVNIARIGDHEATAVASRSVTGTAIAGRQVNINTASSAELEALPGIGQATARAILDYRATHGGFRDVEEIQTARLMPAAAFAKIRDRLTVGDDAPSPAPTGQPTVTIP